MGFVLQQRQSSPEPQSRHDYDAVVVGAGPNGLAAAITLAQAGRRVLVIEARDRVGGAVASGEHTLPGFVHDLGSAIHPLGVGSPFFRMLPLERYGLRWVYSPIPLAHPLDGGSAVFLQRAIAATAAELGVDAAAYQRLMGPITRHWETLLEVLLRPLLPPVLWPPSRLAALAAFGPLAILSARFLANRLFQGTPARALFAGLAGHSVLPFDAPASASFGLVLGMLGHSVGWPFPQGGAQSLADALAAYLRDLGGEIITSQTVHSLGELPWARATLLDLTPRQFLCVAGTQLSESYQHSLGRFRYGPGAFKVDWALRGPIPWSAPGCERAATLHLGGTFDEILQAEAAVARGDHPERPYILLAQHSRFDQTRAPLGMHTAWGYCHTPHDSSFDMTSRIEAQIERFAPGFSECILARHVSRPADLEAWNANLIGGDVGGGALDLRQVIARPTFSLRPYRTPLRGVYLCSASTPPGGGVHGMCGYHAAHAAIEDGC